MKPIGYEDLSTKQREYVEEPIHSSQYLEGPAGAGKTTVGIWRAIKLVDGGITPGSILLLVPQRRLASPYKNHLIKELNGQGLPEILTIAGLARRMVELFWPMIAESAGFQKPDDPPRFLTLETAQYHMSRVVGPYLDEGYFESLSLDRYRLYRQILDNLNKSAVVGFRLEEVGARLSEAWVGPEEQTRIYLQAQTIAQKFRAACYENNLVDFSLQYELLFDYIELLPEFKKYFTERFMHLIVDNVEEETPAGHDFIARWLPAFKSAIIIKDHAGGFSRFLGADPDHSELLRDDCAECHYLDGSFVMSEPIRNFSKIMQRSINGKQVKTPRSFQDAIIVRSSDYLTQLIDWIVEEISKLIHEGNAPSEIAIVSPFLSDSLRFLLMEKLDQAGIAWVSHRPSRAIGDDAFNRSLLTLAALAHPDWKVSPPRESVAQCLMIAIEDLDLVRATLLANTLYRPSDDVPELSAFDQLRPDMQERIGFLFGQRYQHLQTWISQYQNSNEDHLDQFISRLFGEVLAQPGYGFHDQMDAGRAAAAMIASYQKFRSAVDDPAAPIATVGLKYYRLIQEGLLAAQYIVNPQHEDEQAVFISPAFTYLSLDQRSNVQFWLDIGSQAWAERLYQPLTHPYVLSRSWERGQKWTDENEWEVRKEIATTLTTGLTRRCREKIYLCHSSYGEQGLQQQGVLLGAVQRVLAGSVRPEESDDV